MSEEEPVQKKEGEVEFVGDAGSTEPDVGGPGRNYNPDLEDAPPTGKECTTCRTFNLDIPSQDAGISAFRSLPQNPLSGDQYKFKFSNGVTHQYTYSPLNNEQWLIEKFRNGKYYASGSHKPWAGERGKLPDRGNTYLITGTLPLKKLTTMDIALDIDRRFISTPIPEKEKLTNEKLNKITGTASLFDINIDGGLISYQVAGGTGSGSGFAIGSNLSDFEFNIVTVNVTLYVAGNNTLSVNTGPEWTNAKRVFANNLRSRIVAGGVPSSKIEINIILTRDPNAPAIPATTR